MKMKPVIRISTLGVTPIFTHWILCLPIWFEAVDQEEFEDLFYPIMALGGIYDDEENGEVILHLNEKELTQLESDLPHVLLDIYWYWQAIINKPQTVSP